MSRQEAALSSYQRARRAWAAHLRQCIRCAPLERYTDTLDEPIPSMCVPGQHLFAVLVALRKASRTP